MSSIFTKIINRKLKAYIVAEDKNNIAFLDINPIMKGHTLIVPKKEINDIFDLEESDFISLHKFSKKVARALKKTISCKKIGLTVIGLEVPHAHIHLIPINKIDDLDFKKNKINFTSDELVEISEKIRNNFEKIEPLN